MTEGVLMKFYTVLISAVFGCFAACSTVEPPKSFKLVSDENLKPLVNEFLKLCEITLSRGVCTPEIELHVRSKPLNDDTLGHCLVYDNPEFLRVIEIDNQILNAYNLRAVMFHELFHCVLGKPHYDNELDIMNTYEIEENTKIIYDDWETYVKKVLLRD